MELYEMDTEINGLLRVIKTNIKPAVESLRRAFREYPLLVYYYPDDSTREKISRYFVSVAAYHALMRDLPADDQAKVLGGSIARLLNLEL